MKVYGNDRDDCHGYDIYIPECALEVFFFAHFWKVYHTGVDNRSTCYLHGFPTTSNDRQVEMVAHVFSFMPVLV